MKKIYCLNAISSKGTALLNEEYELTENMKEAAGVLVRSASMHEMELPDDLLAVAARAPESTTFLWMRVQTKESWYLTHQGPMPTA